MNDQSLTELLLTALSRIARGDPRNGNALSRREAQDIAREVLTVVDWGWTSNQPNWIDAAAVLKGKAK